MARAIDMKFACFYDPALVGYHPEKRYLSGSIARSVSYCAGTGFVLAKNNYHLMTVCHLLARPLVGIIISLATGRVGRASFQLGTLQGRWWGLQGGAPNHPQIIRRTLGVFRKSSA
jgi:hypothetical protein